MKNVIDWNTEMRIKAFVIPVVALGTLFVAQAQEVDADALISTLNAEIAQVEKKGKETAPSVQKKDEPADDDTFEIVPAKPVTPRASANRPRRNAMSEKSEVVITVRGKGETKDEARNAAFRAAVEKAVGVYVDAESLMKNSELVKDRVNTISNADIKKYETIREGRLTSGLYGMEIKAWVEKKAIAPKFADVFPDAFADVSSEAQTIHVQTVTEAARSADAASLMTTALENVDRMRNWVRLSVVKGKGLCPVSESDGPNASGKRKYSVRYSLKVDEDAYFKGFVPHFKKVLQKMQEGEAEEDVLLSVGEVPQYQLQSLPKNMQAIPVNPFTLTGFPEAEIEGGGPRGHGGNPPEFMFDRAGLAKIQKDRTYNIWLLDRMSKDKTVMRCSAYKVPQAALLAYWKALYGNLDSSYALKGRRYTGTGLPTYEKIEVALLDADGEEITASTDLVPATLLTSGFRIDMQALKRELEGGGFGYVRALWNFMNVFDSFFVRPMFVCHTVPDNKSVYASEIQRDAVVQLTDTQLAEVKKVRIRFVGRVKVESASGRNASGRRLRR